MGSGAVVACALFAPRQQNKGDTQEEVMDVGL